MDRLTPHCIVQIGDAIFNSWKNESLISAEVNLTTDKSGEGVVELYDIDFKIIDGIFSKGVKAVPVTFYFGWGADLGKPFFTGTLARTEWNDGISTLRFHDKSLKMKQGKKIRFHKRKGDYQILKDIAAEHDLKFEVKSRFPQSQPFDSLMQTSTDWDFAKKIASQSGLSLYVKDDTLYAVEAGTVKLNEPISVLNYEADFVLLRGFGLSYKLPSNPKARPKAIEIRGRGKGDRPLIGNAEIEDGGRKDVIVLQDSPQQSVSILNRRAKGKIGKQREYAFEHNLKTLPTFSQGIELRDTVTLAGMGGFYSGDYIVTEIRYLFSAGSLTCEITVGADKKGNKPKGK